MLCGDAVEIHLQYNRACCDNLSEPFAPPFLFCPWGNLIRRTDEESKSM